MRQALVLLLPLVIALGVTAATPAQDPLDSIREQALEALAGKDFDKAAWYVGQLKDYGTEEAAELALDLVEKAKFDSAVAGAAKRAIEAMDGESVEEFVLREAEGDMDWRLRIILVDVIVPKKGARAHEVLVRLLESRKELIQAAAVQGLGKRGDPGAIEPLIVLMKKLDKKKGHVWGHCQAALAKLTGQPLELGADFEIWWKAHGEKAGDGGDGGDGGVAGGAGPGDPPDGREPPPDDPRRMPPGYEKVHDREATFFGMRITCQKIVFIIDVSGSMKTRDPYPPNARTRTRDEPETEPGPDRIRLVRAQKELSNVIENLDSKVEFNIIAYSDLLKQWSETGMKTASKGSKSSAQKFVKQFKAEGTTWTDLALREAYTVNADAHCFYLLSDGSPTHEGGEIPMDTDAIIEQIYAMVPELDIYRRVRIHTLGFQGANVAFMQKLAEMSGGEYADIR